VYRANHKLYEALGGWDCGEKQMRALANRGTCEKIGELIDLCKAADEKALGLLRDLQRAW